MTTKRGKGKCRCKCWPCFNGRQRFREVHHKNCEGDFKVKKVAGGWPITTHYSPAIYCPLSGKPRALKGRGR